MSNKVKRKVTVENSKEGDEHPRRPSVFERLGPNAVNLAAQPVDRHSRSEQNEKCRNWLRTGICSYGNTCRYKHDPFPQQSRRAVKPEKDMEEKDLRHRVRSKRDEPKGSRTGSLSPKRVGKRSNSRSRKGEHESKIKSTVVVTRPRSPTAAAGEPTETKKKADGNWEDDSDDWPMDAAQLDFKEELTLERKRQQLQRELAIELQKERLLNENVTITKTVSFSESSSSSSSSDSGSISSSSGSTSSSSDDDTDDSSSSSSSSSSSGSRPPAKRRNKKSSKDANLEKSLDMKTKDDDYKVKSRSKAHKARSSSPAIEGIISKKSRDKRKDSSQSPKRRLPDARNMGDSRSNLNVRIRGPRTPSPVMSRKQRQWAQSSSTDSRSADAQKNKDKRHKKKRDGSRDDRRKSGRVPSPPPLSSPNRTALMPSISSKKSKREEKSRRRGRDSSPLLSRNAVPGHSSTKLLGNSQRYLSEDKVIDKHRSDDRSKFYSRKEDELLQVHKRTDSRERIGKRNRMSPRKDSHKSSLSPLKDRYDSEILPSMKKLYPSLGHKDEKCDRRQASDSPIRSDRRKLPSDMDKKRDIRDVSPRVHDSLRDNQYRAEVQYDKRTEQKSKRLLSPEPKKGRDDRNRDYSQKDRNVEYNSVPWSDRKPVSSTGRRTPEPRVRADIRNQPPVSQGERSRERNQDRKKKKDRDHSARSEDSERIRLPSPRRSQSPIHGHHTVREIEPLTGNRGGRIYDSDVPAGEREFAYGYDGLHDPYERLLPPDFESDVIRTTPLYPEVYTESRYRRDGKEPIDRYGPRDVLSPREILPHRDIISLTGRSEEYLTDLPVEERGYDERWPRGRSRDDWDSYTTLPSTPLPPHVAAALDEDRYGMPRRRRASPEWQRGRIDERDTTVGGRQVGRGQMPRDGRSRSPAKAPGGNRGAWGDRGGRHDSRHEETQKGGDDRKVRTNKKDKSKRKEDGPIEVKKEKPVKRLHSPSPPPKDVKRRREDTATPETVVTQKASKEGQSQFSATALNWLDRYSSKKKNSLASFKKEKDEGKDSKTALNRVQKSNKLDTSSPRSDVSHSSVIPLEKVDAPKTSEGRIKDREERKARHENAREDDDFSDWSDGDDDLLNRDDFVDSESTNDNTKMRHRSDEKNDDVGSVGSRRREKPLKDQQIRKIKESNSRPSSRDRSVDESSHIKDSKPAPDGKEADVPETSSLKDDAEIVDALDVDWSALMNESKADFKPGCARKRYTAAHVLSRIGFSQVLAGKELSEKIINTCQKQLDEEDSENDGKDAVKRSRKEEKKFTMEHPIAAFHVSVSQTKKERFDVFNRVGPYRRALCARRDLQIRNLLCKPVNKFASSTAVAYSQQYSVADKDLYKLSLELLKRKSPLKAPPTVNVY